MADKETQPQVVGAAQTDVAVLTPPITDVLTEEAPILEADDGASDSDSAFGTDKSDTTSISSSIYAGYLENGRRYQTKREGEYWVPSDEKQFESMQAAHIVYMILDSEAKNPLFRSPIPDDVQHILDVGTGSGVWAVETADRYPGAVVLGVDLYPPPETWVPPNCRFEVDDVLKPWMFENKFDFIHIRDMFASMTDRQWDGVYKQAYENLIPGGWIEQAETGVHFYSDDGSIKEGSLLSQWGDMFVRAVAKGGRSVNTLNTCRAGIEGAGFVNIHEKLYKVPFGGWVKNPVLKEAGYFHKNQILEGLEGYTMYIMTKFGEPGPWSAEEVQVFLAKVREEMAAPGLRSYVYKRRVWAQKPLDTK